MERKYRYQQYDLGFCKVIKTCGSLAVTLKKDLSEKYHIKQGDEVLVVILKRYTLPDELTEQDLKNRENKQTEKEKEQVVSERLQQNINKSGPAR